MHKLTYAKQLPTILASIENGKDAPKDIKPLKEKEVPGEYDVYIEEERITVVKRPEPQPEIIEAVQPPHLQPPPYFAYVALTLSLLLLCYLVTSAFILTFFPPSVTITLLTKSQSIKATGTLQLPARQIPPTTLSQSQTIPTTGRGHQDARSANGYITFYNGLFTSQTVQAGTILTGNDGVQIVTDQNTYIPAANPPSLGYTTVSAHALTKGSSGNISAYDINQACCATAIKAVNTTSFRGGIDERNYQTVTKNDIDTTAATLKTTLSQSLNGALQAQLKQNEQLRILPCTPVVTTDHQIGQETTTVKVTASETCSAVAYNKDALQAQATQVLSTQASKQLGKGYSLLGDIHVTVKQATVTDIHTILTFSCSGVWVYALDAQSQARIKTIIAGKTRQEALHILASLPDIRSASIQWSDDTRLPKNPDNIHIVFFIGLA